MFSKRNLIPISGYSFEKNISLDDGSGFFFCVCMHGVCSHAYMWVCAPECTNGS